MRETFKIEVRKEKPMSSDGIQRLSKGQRSYYRRFVFKPIFRGGVNVDSIDCERSLAYWLLRKFGAGTYVLHSWNRKKTYVPKFKKSMLLTHYTKALCQVEIIKIGNTCDYEYEHTRGIARYGFFISD